MVSDHRENSKKRNEVDVHEFDPQLIPVDWKLEEKKQKKKIELELQEKKDLNDLLHMRSEKQLDSNRLPLGTHQEILFRFYLLQESTKIPAAITINQRLTGWREFCDTQSWIAANFKRLLPERDSGKALIRVGDGERASFCFLSTGLFITLESSGAGGVESIPRDLKHCSLPLSLSLSLSIFFLLS